MIKFHIEPQPRTRETQTNIAGTTYDALDGLPTFTDVNTIYFSKNW